MRSNKFTLRQRFAAVSKSVKHQAAAVGTTLMVAAGTAMAGGGGGPDTSAIEGEFTLYKAAAVGLIIAFCVVLWAKRGAGLLKPGG